MALPDKSGDIPKANSSHSTRSRSRIGTSCLTCHARRARCDRRRPICGLCTRLGHSCAWRGPRFKDDTPQVLQRMKATTDHTNSVWDGNAPVGFRTSSKPIILEAFSPSASSSTGGQRQRQAVQSVPGAGKVVVNQDRFQHLLEDGDHLEIETQQSSLLDRASCLVSEAVAIDIRRSINNAILTRFEVVESCRTVDLTLAESSSCPSASTGATTQDQDQDQDQDAELGLDNEAAIDARAPEVEKLEPGLNAAYATQFRNKVWKKLVTVELDQRNGVARTSIDVLEAAADTFPPLYHAMMAVGALSLALQQGNERVCALQHYQLALPGLHSSLKSTGDLSSDGVLLTHFLLFVYEILNAEGEYSDLCSQHLSTLVQVVLSRSQVLDTETLPFIIWCICAIDLEAVLSGTGSGHFVRSVLIDDSMTFRNVHFYSPGHYGSNVIRSSKYVALPTIPQQEHDVVVLCVRLALLAHEIRKEPSSSSHGRSQGETVVIGTRQRQIFALQVAMRYLWLSSPKTPIRLGTSPTIPSFIRAVFLSRAFMIYSHTSMWPGQRLVTAPCDHQEVELCAGQILDLATRILAEDRSLRRHMVFPVFLAGFASVKPDERARALDLIRASEGQGIGRSIETTRRALAAVQERQIERLRTTGQFLDVDWMEVMREQELTVVNFGF